MGAWFEARVLKIVARENGDAMSSSSHLPDCLYRVAFDG